MVSFLSFASALLAAFTYYEYVKTKNINKFIYACTWIVWALLMLLINYEPNHSTQLFTTGIGVQIACITGVKVVPCVSTLISEYIKNGHTNTSQQST